MTNSLFIKKKCRPFNSFAILFFISSLFFSHASLAQISSAEAAELRAQITALSARLMQLEQSLENNTETIQIAQPVATTSWSDNIEISGDLRPRYENIDDQSAESDRNRNRIRARLNIAAKVSDSWDVAFGIASGDDDPISTNQTLGGGSSTKDLRLDYAFFSYHGINNLVITGGKYKNVFFKPGGQNMIFDGDLRPEGVALKYQFNNLFFNAATMILESDDKANSQDKETMWGMQLGYQFNFENGNNLRIGGSYYDASVAGSQPFYQNKAYRNSVDVNGLYQFDYQQVEIFTEANLTIGDTPLRLFADYVQNLDANANDTGWVIGTKFGNVNNPGSWEIGYNYQDLEADAVFGAFTDSDFGGSGTDSSGHQLKAAIGISDNAEIGFTYFINEYGEASLGEKLDYKRLQVDILLDF